MTLRLGIPSNNRMFDTIFNLFNDAEIPLIRQNRSNFGHGKIWKDIEVYYLRSRDIPLSIFNGGLDCGISTDNVLTELNIQTNPLLRFNFNYHRMVLAAPEKHELSYFKGKRIASAYPNITKKFFADNGVHDIKILDLSGSIEAYPKLHLADGIVDIVETGTSLKENNLVEVQTIMEASPILIGRNDLDDEQKHALAFIVKSLQAAMKAKDFRHLLIHLDDKYSSEFFDLIQKYHDVIFGFEKLATNRFELFINHNSVSKFMKIVSEQFPQILIEVCPSNMIFYGDCE